MPHSNAIKTCCCFNGGFLKGIITGLGFGIGFRIFGPKCSHTTIMTSPALVQERPVLVKERPVLAEEKEDQCGVQSNELKYCLGTNESEISKCQPYMERLSECRKKYSVLV